MERRRRSDASEGGFAMGEGSVRASSQRESDVNDPERIKSSISAGEDRASMQDGGTDESWITRKILVPLHSSANCSIKSSHCRHMAGRLLPPTFSALSSTTMTTKRWLLKAEPDSRIVKGKDVKASKPLGQLVFDPGRLCSSAWTTLNLFKYRLGKACATTRPAIL